MEWISVKDRLPDDDGGCSDMVFVYKVFKIDGSKTIEMDRRVNGIWVNAQEIMWHVTHWMPLPEPPRT